MRQNTMRGAFATLDTLERIDLPDSLMFDPVEQNLARNTAQYKSRHPSRGSVHKLPASQVFVFVFIHHGTSESFQLHSIHQFKSRHTIVVTSRRTSLPDAKAMGAHASWPSSTEVVAIFVAPSEPTRKTDSPPGFF